MCRFCWHEVKENLNGKCPACRQTYEEENYTFTPPNAEECAIFPASPLASASAFCISSNFLHSFAYILVMMAESRNSSPGRRRRRRSERRRTRSAGRILRTFESFRRISFTSPILPSVLPRKRYPPLSWALLCPALHHCSTAFLIPPLACAFSSLLSPPPLAAISSYAAVLSCNVRRSFASRSTLGSMARSRRSL